MVSIRPGAKQTRSGYEVTFGRSLATAGLRFLSPSFRVFNSRQSLNRIGTGAAAIDRAAREDAHPGSFGGFERGILTGTELKDWRQAIGYLEYNEGIQFRTGRGCLPYAVTNYASVTSDEDISGAVAAGWRRHDCVSAVGGSADVWYSGAGHKLYRDSGDGSPEVAATFTDVVSCVAELYVGGAKVFAVACKGATDDIKYTADPTASPIVWTTLVALSSGDHITAMRAMRTLGTGDNIVIGKVGGTRAVWRKGFAATAAWTLEPVALTATKDTSGSFSTSNTGATSPVRGWSIAGSGNTSNLAQLESQSGTASAQASESRWSIWTNAGHVTTDDANYAQADYTHAYDSDSPGSDFAEVIGQIAVLTDVLVASGHAISAIPNGAHIVGIVARNKAYEASTANNIYYWRVQLVLNGSLVGENRADGEELTDTAAYKTFGSSTDRWGLPDSVRGRDINAGQLGLGVQFVSAYDLNTAGKTGSALVGHSDLNVYYQLPGATTDFGDGWMIARHNEYPNRISIVDDLGEVWHLDFAWQTDQERSTFAFQQPNEGMRHVWAACPYQDGYAYAGQNVVGPGFYLKHERPSGVLNYSFPGKHGDMDVRINGLTRADDWLILEVVHYTAGTSTVVDLQKWFFTTVPDRAFSADTLLQSKTNNLAISSAPLPSSIMLNNPAEDLMYSIFPNSTDTAFRAERVQPDLGADPLFVNADWVKSMAWTDDGGWAENTGLKARTPRLNVGPTEALKAITVVRYGDRLVSEASGESRGSVTVEMETGGDRTFAAPAVSHEFTDPYEEYEAPGGAKYRDLIGQLTVTHDAGTAETPAVCPIDFETQQKWPTEIWIAVKVHSESARDWFKFIADYQTLEEDGCVTQELKIANLRDAPADYEDASAGLGALAVCEGWPDGVQPEMLVPEPGEPVRFVDARGAPVEPTMLFRIVRGATA